MNEKIMNLNGLMWHWFYTLDYVNRAIYDCPGFWDRSLKWHEGHIWPEEALVDDFIYFIKYGEMV